MEAIFILVNCQIYLYLIGSYDNGSYLYLGKLSDISLFDEPLNSTQITTIYNSGEPTDLSTFSLKSFAFDGVDDYIDCGANTSLQPTTAITLSAWFSADALQWGTEDLISQDHVPWGSLWKGYNIGCHIGTNTILYYHFGLGDGSSETQVVGNDNSLGPYPYAINTWYHLCGTWDGSTMTMYINGISLGTTAFSGPISYDATQNTYIGRRGHGQAFYWDGGIDDVAIWNTGKSASEVLAIYNSGKPSDLSEETGLVGYCLAYLIPLPTQTQELPQIWIL